MYDANCDGVLDFDEFSKGITMCQLDHLFPRSLQRALFDRVDTNKVSLARYRSPGHSDPARCYQKGLLKLHCVYISFCFTIHALFTGRGRHGGAFDASQLRQGVVSAPLTNAL